MAEGMAYGRVTNEEETQDIADLIASARDVFEDFTGRALISQQWTLFSDDWNMRPVYTGREQNIARPFFYNQGSYPYLRVRTIIIPRSPLISIDSIKYFDPSNVLQTVAPTGVYSSFPSGVSSHGGVFLLDGQVWPAIANRPDAVQVTFTAGYGSVPTAVPARMRQALRLMVHHYYDNRSSVVVERATVDELPMTMRDIMIACRVEMVVT